MKILFFGYSQIGYRAVHLLAERRPQGDEILGIVTHRDDPHENRWYKTPAKAAQELGMSAVFGEDLGAEALSDLAERVRPDLVLSVMYRDLLPARVLQAARIAALNLHPSLLPAYRGRAPINWVLVNGERETGVTLHHMVVRADAGDIVGQRRIEIAPRETALTLYHKIEEEGIALMRELLPQVAAGTAPSLPQDNARASKFGRRRPDDGRIDWSWSAHRIDCLVRAVAPPWPGAFFERDGRRIAVHAGEPAGPVEPGIEPGTLRREGGQAFISAADRWFRVDDLREPRSRTPAR